MTRSFAVPLLALAAIAVAPGARAQTPAPQPRDEGSALADAVELKNGAYLRGLILEVDPASHLTLKLPNGEVRKIPIAEVVSAERSGKALKLPSSTETPGAAPAPPAEAQPPAAQPAKPAAPPKAATPPTREVDRLLAAVPGPRMTLSVASNRDAYLERQIGSSSDDDLVAYHLVCRLPCRLQLPALDPVRYRVDGQRTESSEWFNLPRRDSKLEVHLVSDMWPLWPRALLVGSVIFGVIGGGFLGGYALADGATWVRNVGIGFAGVSGGLLLTSGVLFLVRPETSLSFEPPR